MSPNVPPAILLDAVRKARLQRAAEDDLYEFVKQAWHVVEPGVDFVHGWHLELICEHLQAVTDGEIRDLLINIPPRHAKSTIVSVLWPMWEWIHAPHHKFLCASYSSVLSIRDNLKSRRLVTSPWYQERWGNIFQLSGDQNAKQRYENNRTGYRIATSVGGTATGEGGNRLVLDDPHGAQDAQSDAMRLAAIEWFDMVWSTRKNDPKRDAMVTIMQRLHEGDVSGRILQLGGWEHLCLPAEFDGRRRSTKVERDYDPRKTQGALLWPERFGEEELTKLKKQLGEYGTAGQLQQQPAPPGGGILKTSEFRMWPRDAELPVFEYILQSYDTAFEEKELNDPSACSVWGLFMWKGKYNALLLDTWAERLSYPDLRSKVLGDWRSVYGRRNNRKGRKADAVLIEKKASGQSLLQDLRSANVPVLSYLPMGQKVARAHQAAPILELGCLWIPESNKEPGNFVLWARDFLKELALFPNAEHDDYTDTFTQAIIRLRDDNWFDLEFVEPDPVEEEDYHKQRRDNPYAA